MAKTRPATKDLFQEIATIERDVIRPVYGGLLRPDDDTLMSRGQGKGLRIYDDLERDCHAYAVLQKRKMAVVSREWGIEPATESPADKRAAEIVEGQLRALPLDRICLGLLDSVLKGYAVAEVMWEIREGEIAVADIRAREQRRFVFGEGGELRLLTPEDMNLGVPVPDRKFIVQSFGAKDGNPYGLGLGTRLFWPVFFKRQGITFWLTFADKFGNPTAVGKYPVGASPDEQKKLLASLQALAHDVGIIMPEGMMVELLEAQRSGSINTHESLARYMDEQMSEAVLGETLTTNIGKTGSYAASETHNEVREELVKADADLQSDVLNASLVTWITELNVPGARPPRFWRDFEEPEDLKATAERDRLVYDMGFEPSEEYIREKFGEGWTKKPKTEGWTPAEPPAFAEPVARDAVDGLAEQTDAVAAPSMDQLIDAVRDLLASATSLEEIPERLLQLYPSLATDDLARTLGQAMVAAELTGRTEADGGRS